MSTEEVIKESFGEVVKGKKFDKNTEISSLGIDSLDLVESLMSMEENLVYNLLMKKCFLSKLLVMFIL